jgi:dienelactone hydrolase
MSANGRSEALITKRAALGAAALVVMLSVAPASAAPVEVPALPDAPELRLLWQPTTLSGRRPVVVALHGCGGLTTRGALDARYVDYAARWNAAGWHVLLPDSFSARGTASICRESGSERSITVATRRADVNRALQWAAAQPQVDPRRIALVGWSNGGSTVLRTVEQPAWTTAPVAAVALYPSCARAQRRGEFAAAIPLLLLVGALDDWTPPQPCVELARIAARPPAAAPVELVVYEGSYHGFDDTRAPRRRTDIRSGVDPAGVHVGGNPAARADTLARTDAFLRHYLD